MLRVLLVSLMLLVVGASQALATCYTCTLSEPHICVPASPGKHGWQECYDGPTPEEPCEVNWQTGCTGGSGIDPMLATRTLVLYTSAEVRDRFFAGLTARTLRGRGTDLSPEGIGQVLGLGQGESLELAGSYFSLGDADLVRPVTVMEAPGCQILARDSFRGAVFAMRAKGQECPSEIRVQSGDLTFVAITLDGQAAIVALASERITPDHPDLLNHLTAIQVRFKGEAEAWGSTTEPELFANR